MFADGEIEQNKVSRLFDFFPERSPFIKNTFSPEFYRL